MEAFSSPLCRMTARLFASILLVLLIVACRPRAEIQFCEAGTGLLGLEHPFVIDVDQKRFRTIDTSETISWVRTEFAAGIVKPIPLLLPTVPLEQVPSYWELEGYRFATSLPESDPDGAIWIDADPLQFGAHRVHRTSIRYSSTDGILSLRLSSRSRLMSEDADFVPCGKGVLTGASFRE